MPKFAANLSFLFQDLSFLDRFDAAAGAGFKGVEYLFPYDFPASDIKSRLDGLGLTQAFFNLAPGDWEGGERGIAALPGREDEFRRYVGQALDYAKALGCTRVHAMAGLLPEGAERARYETTYVENLRHAAETLGREGVRLHIEPLNIYDAPGYLLNKSSQGAAFIEAVNHENLFLQFDAYHTQIMEGNLAATFERRKDIIGHIQIAGVPGRFEPDVGEINYPYLFACIDASGYDGWIGCEYRPRGTTLEGLGWAKPYGIG